MSALLSHELKHCQSYKEEPAERGEEGVLLPVMLGRALLQELPQLQSLSSQRGMPEHNPSQAPHTGAPALPGSSLALPTYSGVGRVVSQWDSYT